MRRAESSLSVALMSKATAGAPTGLSRYAQSLYNALAAAGINVIAQTPPRLPLPGILAKTGYDLGAFLASYPVWASYSRRASIYHLTSQNLATLLTLLRPPVPTVVTVHDIIPFVLRNNVRLSSYRHVFDRWADRCALAGLSRADAIIADSAATRRDLRKHVGIAADRIAVVPLGVDSEHFRPRCVSDSVLRSFGLDAAARYVLYVGSEALHKNVTGLMEAFARVSARLPDVRLLKAGAPHAAAQRQELVRLVKRLGLNGKVIFLDAVADADLPLLYSLATVFVSPSLYEGFGLPALEAMACGTPVVCFDAASLPDVVGDAGILVPAGDTEGLAEGILAVLNDDALRRQLIEAGLARARAFTWERTARMTIDVYQTLASPIRQQALVS